MRAERQQGYTRRGLDSISILTADGRRLKVDAHCFTAKGAKSAKICLNCLVFDDKLAYCPAVSKSYYVMAKACDFTVRKMER